MSEEPQLLLAHHLKALRLPPGNAPPRASTTPVFCCAWPSSN